MLFRTLVLLTAGILGYQLFVPPIVGLADQGDFVCVIGRFGYGQEPAAPSLKYLFVPPKYVPNNFRVPEWEQPTSESLFVAVALFVNKIVSKDGSLAIQMVGLIHAVAFLLIYARLLRVTAGLRNQALLWIGATCILTDAGYVAYWNSLYREPASFLFCLLLVADTISICRTGAVSTFAIWRWTMWAVLFLTAKEQNTPLHCSSRYSRSDCDSGRQAWRQAAILAAGTLNIVTSPAPEQRAVAYNMLFLGITPESRNAAADLEVFGLSSRLVKYSGTNAWSPNTGFYEAEL